ncbi:MAG: 1-deoxy-D-xylulose-5-phosphate synthase [Defluviitaleaceae bacterium]|nr:1-deoxy-D-xylulose-5-phosphate synthase [Defluviitaleaceae bacterium]
MRYLDKADSPQDLKRFTVRQLSGLATEMRDFLVQSVAKTGGHLGSNLGVVELAIALHYCMDSPVDKLIWDVGHQCYPHKILTGRREQFDTLRQFGGMSGFIKSSESPHDVFDVGHSSTSLSVAHGIAVSRDLKGENYRVAAVIGDGALTSGLALEGLNNLGQSKSNVLVVLNDNQMSISENVGAMSKYLNNMRTAPSYINVKNDVRRLLERFPKGGQITQNVLGKTRTRLKYTLLQGVLFEELGFKYYGPIDGHNLGHLVDVLGRLQDVKGPVLLHVMTQKGKGYAPAERQAMKFHGIEPFDPRTGETLNKEKKTTYTDVFSMKMVDLGRHNEDIATVTAAMPSGTGLTEFKKHYPKRFFDVGIAESHAVTFAAAMAKNGLRPIVAIYSTFLQRAYDQLLHDICIQNLPVVFALDRSGIVAADGETHQGIFDLSYLAHMPNMTVLAPRNAVELEAMMDFAVEHSGPVAIRYAKDEVCKAYKDKFSPIEYGEWEVLEFNEANKIAILAVGSMVGKAAKVREKMIEAGYNVSLINPRFVSPILPQSVKSLCGYEHILVMEENVISGGFGQHIISELSAAKINEPKVHIFGVDGVFPPQGTRDEIFAYLKLDVQSMYEKIVGIING